MRKVSVFTLLIFPALLLIIPDAAVAADKIKVFVSIQPQAYFIERIGGSLVDVGVLVGPGQSPATFEPTPRQMARLARARLYFRIGVPFENSFMRKIKDSFKNLKVIDTRKGVNLLAMEEFAFDDTHQEPEMHSNRVNEGHLLHAGQPDPHIWLDPLRVKIQAGTIAGELIEIDPANKDTYQGNLMAFKADLDAVHAKIAGALSPYRGREVLVFHPAYGYFCDSFGLRQVAIESGGKPPGARQMTAVIEKAAKAKVKAIFVQPQFSDDNARAVAGEIGAKVVPLDPMSRDYLRNLEDIAAKIEESFK
jgi:zinc transport system substrate-binding protein